MLKMAVKGLSELLELVNIYVYKPIIADDKDEDPARHKHVTNVRKSTLTHTTHLFMD